MPLLACGINHQTAPIALREQLVFAPDQLGWHLHDLISIPQVHEAAILSTCNRTELYCDAKEAESLLEWLKTRHPARAKELSSCLYFYEEQDAVKHMMRVACGLDSMVIGEPQIVGQMKSAFVAACQAGTIGKQLQRLFQYIFTVTKHVRTDTAIGASPVSIAYAAVDMARRIFADLSQTTALLIGAGETIELAARHLQEQGVQQLLFANRTLSKAKQMAVKWSGKSFPMARIADYLCVADIVITATSSTLPILGKGSVETALKSRKRRPILMLDIAVPRDIESEIGNLPDVYLYTVDDLKEVIEENLKGREAAAKQAQKIIDFQAAHYMRTLRSLDSVPIIRGYRERVEAMRDEELSKAMEKLHRGASPEEVLITLARILTNKLLHGPCTQLRQAAYEGQKDLLAFARQLFDLKE